MIKPQKLNKGDKVATISLSTGMAGDQQFRYRYELGRRRLAELFGLEVIAMPNSLKGSQYLYENPQARAEDFMNAFKDPSIKGIFSNIGGDDTLRILPYIDLDVIKENPSPLKMYKCMLIPLSLLLKPCLVAK